MTLQDTYSTSLGLVRDALCHLIRAFIAVATIFVLHAALLIEWSAKGLSVGMRITTVRKEAL